MAMNTSYLIAFIGAGFIMLFIGWPWWLGIGLIIVSMAAAVSGDEDTEQLQESSALSAAGSTKSAKQLVSDGKPKVQYSKEMVAWAKDAKKWGDVEDLIWSPGVPSDGMFGVNPMGAEEVDGVRHGVGPTTGQSTTDLGPIRVKDDLRFLPGRVDKTFMADPYGEKAFMDFRFRTSKMFAWPEKTRMNETFAEQVDKDFGMEMMSPWRAEKEKLIKKILDSQK